MDRKPYIFVNTTLAMRRILALSASQRAASTPIRPSLRPLPGSRVSLRPPAQDPTLDPRRYCAHHHDKREQDEDAGEDARRIIGGRCIVYEQSEARADHDIFPSGLHQARG